MWWIAVVVNLHLLTEMAKGEASTEWRAALMSASATVDLGQRLLQ